MNLSTFWLSSTYFFFYVSIRCPIPGELEVYKIPSGEYQIWAKSMIQFWNLRKSLIFTNDEESRPILYPEDNYNAFTVRDLL